MAQTSHEKFVKHGYNLKLHLCRRNSVSVLWIYEYYSQYANDCFSGETPAGGNLRTLLATRIDAVSAMRYFWRRATSNVSPITVPPLHVHHKTLEPRVIIICKIKKSLCIVSNNNQIFVVVSYLLVAP